MDVNLASQAHQVPQVGFPHNEPVIIAKNVNNNPMGAILFAIKFKFFISKIAIWQDKRSDYRH